MLEEDEIRHGSRKNLLKVGSALADESMWSQFLLEGLSILEGSTRVQAGILESREQDDLEAQLQRPHGSPTSAIPFATLSQSAIPGNELGGPQSLSSLANRIREAEPEMARILVFRLFGGLTFRQIAGRTSQALEAVRRDWENAKRWMGPGIGSVVDSPSSLTVLDTVDVGFLKALHRHPELLRSLDWRTFEKVLAGTLERLGYEIELQRGTKDGGIDIFALKRVGAFGSDKYLIQAKRWSNRVGVSPVRELLFLQGHHKVTKGCLATTTAFTRGAWRLAGDYRWQLELRDYEGLKEWIALAANSR